MLTTTILSILAWMSFALTTNNYLKKGYGSALLVTACGIILVLFLGMILGSLGLTYYLIIVGAFIQAVLRGWSLNYVREKLRSSTITLGKLKESYIVLYGISLITVIIFVRKVYPDFLFFGWDEFSHWARYTKILVDTSVAPLNNPSVLFPAYPPGINLWHYFICGPGGYAEWKVVFSQMLLVTAAIICISSNFGKLKGMGTITIFVFGLALYHAFGTSLYEIYTDYTLGLLFAAGLLIARNLALDVTNRAVKISFIVILATISLIKPISIIFAVTICGLFLGLRLVLLLTQRFTKQSDTDNAKSKPAGLLKSLLETTSHIAAAFSTVWIWKIYTSINSVVDQLVDSQKVGISEIYEFLFTRETAETQMVWKELSDRIGFERISTFGEKQIRLDEGFFNPDSPIYHGPIYLLWVMATFFALRLVFNHKKVFFTLAEGVYLTATFLMYMLVIVFMTRFFFQIYEIERLASLERYLSSFLLGIMLYAFTTLVTDVSRLGTPDKAGPKRIAFPVMWMATAMYFLNLAPVALDNVFARPLEERPVPAVHPWANEYSELADIRGQILSLSNIVKTNAEPNDKVYVVAQNETGFTFYITGHELSPLQTNKNCFSLGLKYSEGDVWTCEWMDLSTTLRDYQYLVVRLADEAFWKRFGSMFEQSALGSKSGVFKVEKDVDKKISLKTIYLSDEARGADSPQ